MLESFQVPADEVLGEFRAKVQEVVRPEDVQTHYDLGIAYKEMGLLEEAAAEFQVALRHGRGTRAADSLTMLGMCEMERGNTDTAIRHFRRGLGLLDLTPAARHALQYELGAAYEIQGLSAEALEQYQAISAEEPRFRDVGERVQRMGGDLKASGRAIPRRPTAPASAPQKVAARSTTAPPSAASRSTTAPSSAASPDAAADAGRKNRKIGFV